MAENKKDFLESGHSVRRGKNPTQKVVEISILMKREEPMAQRTVDGKSGKLIQNFPGKRARSK